jgi:hypothetical protein
LPMPGQAGGQNFPREKPDDVSGGSFKARCAIFKAASRMRTRVTFSNPDNL